jgi:uncharacterized protein (DUF488 family)
MRQRFLLVFIRQINESVSSTDLQKLVFLYTMKENPGFYDFLPYKYGAYSFQLAEDLDILQRDGYLTIEKTTEKTQINAAGELPLGAMFDIAAERGNNLIRKAYREHPYYTVKSEILTRLFCEKELDAFNAERLKYKQDTQTLFTIGYEGNSIESFINILIHNDIKLLCDVRKNPLSRKFGFSKNMLKHIAEGVGIKYLHIPALGIESNKRTALETPDDYKALFADYAKTLPDLTPWLEGLYRLLLSNTRIALMCYEKEALMCHRHVVRDYLINRYGVNSRDL